MQLAITVILCFLSLVLIIVLFVITFYMFSFHNEFYEPRDHWPG